VTGDVKEKVTGKMFQMEREWSLSYYPKVTLIREGV